MLRLGNNQPSRAELDAIADAAKLPTLPETCPKCGAGVPWLQHDRTCAHCHCCGWTGYMKVVVHENVNDFLSPRELMRKAALDHLATLSKDEIQRHMAKMRAARKSA